MRLSNKDRQKELQVSYSTFYRRCAEQKIVEDEKNVSKCSIINTRILYH